MVSIRLIVRVIRIVSMCFDLIACTGLPENWTISCAIFLKSKAVGDTRN